MEFNYSEEQLGLQDTLQRFISRDYDFDKRRGFSASPLGYSAEAWSQYAELGLLALPFPEELGGLGGNAIDIMVVMEQFGQGLLLEPFLSTVVTCGGLLRDAASPALKQKLVPQIAEGKLKLSLAAYEAAGRYDLSFVACTAQESGGNWRLSGRKTVVLDGASADYFLVSARSSGKAGDRDGISLFLVPHDAKGLTTAAYPTQSGARAADLLLENVVIGAEALIGEPGRALGLIERAVDRAIAALCAEAVGAMAAMHEATVAYMKTRKQFGVTIGSFQVLQHRAAEMLIAVEQARSMAMLATMMAAEDDARERRQAISAAKVQIGRSGRFVGQQAIQIHGGIGMTMETKVGHYFKRVTVIDTQFGDADYHLDAVAAGGGLIDP